MPRYNVPITSPDGEVFWHPVDAPSPGAALQRAMQQVGGFGMQVGTPLQFRPDPQNIPGLPPQKSATPAYDPMPGGAGTFRAGFSDLNPEYQGQNPTGAITTGTGVAFDPRVQAKLAEDRMAQPSALGADDTPLESFDKFDLMGGQGPGGAQSQAMGSVKKDLAQKNQNLIGSIRSWSDRVADINVIGTPGAEDWHVYLPSDMFRYGMQPSGAVGANLNPVNKIDAPQIRKVMEHIAATEGRDAFQGAMNSFMRQLTDFLQANPDKLMSKFVDQQFEKGDWQTEEFKADQKDILKNVIGKREEEVRSKKPVVAVTEEGDPWDDLPDYWKVRWDEYQKLTGKAKEAAANHNLPSYWNQRPGEYANLNSQDQTRVLSNLAPDAKSLEQFNVVEQPAPTGWKPDDNLDDFTTFAEETGKPGAVWEPIDETGFEEDKALDVGPDITLPPDAPTYQPAPPVVPKVVDPNAVNPNVVDPNMVDPNMVDPNMVDPNLSFEANMQGVLDNRGLFEVSPTAGYRRAFGNVFGEGFGRRGPIGGYLQGLQDPLTAAFQGGAIRNLLNPQPGLGLGAGDAEGMALPGQSFQSFLQQAQSAPGGLGSAWDQALQDVNTFRGMQQADIPVAAQQYFAPQSLQDVGQAARLMGAAQRARYSPLVSGMFRPQSYEDLYGDYVLQNQDRANAGEAMPANFYDFAASRFGL